MVSKSTSEGVRTRRAEGVSSSPWAGWTKLQMKQSGRRSPLSLSRFVLLRTSADRVGFHMLGGLSALLSLWMQRLISSKISPTDTPGMMFDQTPGHPVAQSS